MEVKSGVDVAGVAGVAAVGSVLVVCSCHTRACSVCYRLGGGCR